MVRIRMLLLIAAMLISAAFSCSEPAKTSADTAKPVSAEATAPDMSDAELLSAVTAALPDRDYDGYVFIIMTREESASPYWFTRDVFSESLDGEPVNDAVYNRNSMMEDRYNIAVCDMPSGGSPVDAAQKLILAGDDAFAAVTDGINALSLLSAGNRLIDYNILPEITLDGEWWDRSMIDGMSVSNRLYYLTGDISIMDNEGTWHVLFNKDMQTDLNLDNLYALVDSGGWIMPKLHETAKSAASDLDGDGKMTPMTDRFGFASEPYNTYSLWVGGGMQIASKDENDLPALSMSGERSADVAKRALDIQLDGDIFVNHNDNMEIFSSGTVMFQLVGMRVLPVYRQSEVNFGILPLPKYNEEQEKYYTAYSSYNLTAYSVPITTTDTGRTAILLNAMAAMSRYTLTPAYYEISLKGKYIRDDESAGMIDMILNNRLYDIGLIYNWGGALDLFINMTDAGTYDFTSRWAAIEAGAQSEMEKYIASLD